MIFHIFDFGPLSATVQEYADQTGRIPGSEEERWQDYEWPRDQKKAFANLGTGQAAWEEFRRGAIQTTQRALKALDELQSNW